MSTHPLLTVALDSSGPTLRVAVTDGQKTYTARKTGIKQENFFLPLLQKVLQKAGGTLADIKRVVFVRGPGRFTGIRISLTFASMMQSLNGAKVSSATAFELIERQVRRTAAFKRWQQAHPEGVMAVVLHAFREEYFLQFFDKAAQGPKWLSREELLREIKQYPAPLYIAGSDKEQAALDALLQGCGELAPAAEGRVQLKTLLALAGDETYEQHALEPLYLKPARFELGQ